MAILTDLSQIRPEPTCLTIGYFDGVHRGHRYLINRAIASARRDNLRMVLLTFYPHPNVVLRGAEPFYLSTRMEKLALLSQLDLDEIIIQPFTPGLAQTRASAFIDWLIKQIGMVRLWIGPDFALGYRREGDVAFLQEMGQERGFTVDVVERLKLEDGPITSSRIRKALREGDVTLAARCLGRPYSLHGPVAVGAQRGRTLGFPTANVEVPEERAVPANGVYAAWARLHPDRHLNKPLDGLEAPEAINLATELLLKEPGEERHRAVVNIGIRPTFDQGPRTIEAHLLDFYRDLYGQRLILDFVSYLRPEQRFDSADALTAQIQQDIELAYQFLHE